MCPITFEVMGDPVSCADGHSYDRAAITRWLQDHNTSPKTGMPLEHTNLVPNHALRSAIQDWQQEQEAAMREIPVDQLAFDAARPIGTGAFKSVFAGTLTRPGGRQPEKVAVLKVRAGDCAAEAATLARLGCHTRLVKYIGQCSPAPGGGTSQLLVTEFAPHGGLDAALERLEDQGRPLPLGHQLTILRQVCTGMHELTAEQLVHRDLALRNVLVFALDPAAAAAKVSVKVSDFGLTIDRYGRG